MDVNFIWIGYNKQDNHDKVWGVLTLEKFSPIYHMNLNKPVYIFWGGRGKSLAFKEDRMTYSITKLSASKEKRGYKEINETKLRELWPDFDETLNQRLMLHILKQ